MANTELMLRGMIPYLVVKRAQALIGLRLLRHEVPLEEQKVRFLQLGSLKKKRWAEWPIGNAPTQR